jgi:hypothetical protein
MANALGLWAAGMRNDFAAHDVAVDVLAAQDVFERLVELQQIGLELRGLCVGKLGWADLATPEPHLWPPLYYVPASGPPLRGGELAHGVDCYLEEERPSTPRDWARHLRAALAPDATGQLVLHRRDIQGLALVLEGLVATVAQLEGYVQTATDEAAKLRQREAFTRRGEAP